MVKNGGKRSDLIPIEWSMWSGMGYLVAVAGILGFINYSIEVVVAERKLLRVVIPEAKARHISFDVLYQLLTDLNLWTEEEKTQAWLADEKLKWLAVYVERSNRTYWRIVASLPLEVSRRYGYLESATDRLEQQMQAAIAGKDWSVAKMLAGKLELAQASEGMRGSDAG